MCKRVYGQGGAGEGEKKRDRGGISLFDVLLLWTLLEATEILGGSIISMEIHGWGKRPRETLN